MEGTEVQLIEFFIFALDVGEWLLHTSVTFSHWYPQLGCCVDP